MSLKKIVGVKSDKGFKLQDLLIYGAILIIVAALFITIFCTRDKSELSGIEVYSDNVLLYEYDFENLSGNILHSESVEVLSETKDELHIKISAFNGFNEIVINKSYRAVKVCEADCGNRTCVFMPEITDNNSLIYCPPHRLKILPKKYDSDAGRIPVG